jgi:hypothetical protein
MNKQKNRTIISLAIFATGGSVFCRFGWTACVACIGSTLAVAALLTARLTVGKKPSVASLCTGSFGRFGGLSTFLVDGRH